MCIPYLVGVELLIISYAQPREALVNNNQCYISLFDGVMNS